MFATNLRLLADQFAYAHGIYIWKPIPAANASIVSPLGNVRSTGTYRVSITRALIYYLTCKIFHSKGLITVKIHFLKQRDDQCGGRQRVPRQS
jgi:hypothetical protein